MDESRINTANANLQATLIDYSTALNSYTAGVRKSTREACGYLVDEVDIRITSTEATLTRTVALVYEDAEYHVLSAYYHASPGLFAFIVSIFEFIGKVIGVIKTIDEIARIILGESLASLLDRIIPGFENAWNEIMNHISKFSAALGWGVDGVNHLMNAVNTSATTWGMLTGKSFDMTRMARFQKITSLTRSMGNTLDGWQKNPGMHIALAAETFSFWDYKEGGTVISNFTNNIKAFGDKAETALTGVGNVTSELLALRNDMPKFISDNLPKALWDGIERVDTAINERILPALTDITDKLEEIDGVLEAHRVKADALADKIAHPGDLLSEIDKLPGYARQEQLDKIDSITSEKQRAENEAMYAAMEGDLREFGIIAEALTHAPPSLPFMELEMPGRSPGIVVEPRETWFVGDF